MKKLIFVGLFLTSSLAMAVERNLPVDAHNVRVVSAVIDWVGVGSKPILNTSTEGPASETIFAKRLVVTVKYDSKDTTDVNQTGSGIDGQILATDDQTPTVTYYVKLSPQKLAAIEAGRVSASSLVSMNVVAVPVVMDDPNYQYQCRYDFDSNVKLDKNCEEHPNKVTQVRPVLNLSVANQ